MTARPTVAALLEALVEAGVTDLDIHVGTGRRNPSGPAIGLRWSYTGHDTLGNLSDHGIAATVEEALETALLRLIDTRRDQGMTPLEHPAALAVEFGHLTGPACGSCVDSCSTSAAAPDVDPAEEALLADGTIGPDDGEAAIRRERAVAQAYEEEWASRRSRRSGRAAMAEDFAAVIAPADEVPDIEGTDEARRAFKAKMEAWRREGSPLLLPRSFRAAK